MLGDGNTLQLKFHENTSIIKGVNKRFAIYS